MPRLLSQSRNSAIAIAALLNWKVPERLVSSPRNREPRTGNRTAVPTPRGFAADADLVAHKQDAIAAIAVVFKQMRP